MQKRKVNYRNVFQPSDTIAFVVIIIGLFIALFLDEMAVRLIGVCITILGGVALFMMVSPRLSDMSMPRPPKPTENLSFMSQTTRDGGRTRQVFDSTAYRATFGAEDSGTKPPDERQIGLFPELMEVPEPLTAVPTVPADNTPSTALLDVEFADGQSSVRVVGVRSARSMASAPQLAINARIGRNKPAAESEVVAAATSQAPPHDEPVTEELRISEELVVRPKIKVPVEEPVPVQVRQDTPESDVPEIPHADTAATAPEIETAGMLHQDDSESDSSEPASRAIKEEIRVSSFMDDDDDELEDSAEPRKEFDYLLNRVLMVIRSATNARTAAFFWFNRDRNQLVLQARISNAEQQFTDQRKIPIGQDVVSQIALEGRPEIVTDIVPSAELELLPYYKYRAGTLSFVGVPVYFRGNVVGVLCADSMEENAYTDVTVGFFGHFTKLISALVLNYTSKFDLQQHSRLLQAVLEFRSTVADAEPSLNNIVSALFGVIIRNIEVSTVGSCMYDREQKIWTLCDVKSVLTEYGPLVGTGVDLEGSLAGECIRNGETIAVSVEDGTTRITPSEPPIALCQFVAVPMRSLLHTHGALVMENHKGTITSHDVTMAELLADIAGEMIAGLRDAPLPHHIQAAEIAEEADETIAFNSRAQQEVLRAADYQSDLTLCFIEIDPPVGIRTGEISSTRTIARDRVGQQISKQIRDYDAVFKISGHTLAVLLIGSNASEAMVWAESLRRDVASSQIPFGDVQASVTISVGIAEHSSSDSWLTFAEHAQTALDVSTRQNNMVTVYS
ncbi:MAG: GAF domain-containing protein [Ignavibacteria bacterium]|nr:MAG: GAF domain-containing protein [Ignavibacteria bacterium]